MHYFLEIVTAEILNNASWQRHILGDLHQEAISNNLYHDLKEFKAFVKIRALNLKIEPTQRKTFLKNVFRYLCLLKRVKRTVRNRNLKTFMNLTFFLKTLEEVKNLYLTRNNKNK